MTAVVVILGGYLVASLVLGWMARDRGDATAEDWFVASRTIGPVVLFFTLAATNFSAFFYVGFAGASYAKGFAFYGLLAMGTSLVGVSMLLLGLPTWKLGQEHGYLTPPEMVAGQTGSRVLGIVFALVLIVFTLPYLAIQPHAAGILLEQLTDGAIPRFAAAVGLTLVMLAYLWMGGMRSSAWTDLFQALVMIGLLAVGVVAVMRGMGGFASAGDRLFASNPELFVREGKVTVRQWVSFMLLWPMTVPMFPQMFQRFYIAKSPRGLTTAAWLYPIVVALLFLLPVLFGVYGHLDFPDLQGKEADQIVALLLGEHVAPWLAALVLTGAIAAFMSTADSQLLAMSSIITRDVLGGAVKAPELWVGRVAMVVLAAMGLAIAYEPPGSIFDIIKQAFTGLAVLLPTVVAVLYWPRVRAEACIVSICVGEALVFWSYLGGLPERLTMGMHPSTSVVAITAATLVAVTLALPTREAATPIR